MKENYDVIIIGGGIIGASIAAHLALVRANETESLKVALINTSNLGTPASIAAAGLFQLQLCKLENPLLKDYSYKSFEYFLKFYENIRSSLYLRDIDLGFKQAGSLYLIFSLLETANRENELKDLKKIEPNASFLNKHEAFKIEPNITKEILGAYHYPNEGFINNPKFLKTILLYCSEHKINLINTEVTELKIKNSRIECINLKTGESLQAKKYVLCNGAWANNFLKRMLNINETIIKSIRGEILEIAVREDLPINKIVFCQEGYLVPRLQTNQFEKPSVLIGSTCDEIDLETTKEPFKNTISGTSKLCTLLQKLLPSCKNMPIINMWAGLRPNTKDNMPILGYVPEINNLVLALGHYRSGLLMGPYTGKIIKDLLLGNTLDCNIEPFKIERFLKHTVLTNQPVARC